MNKCHLAQSGSFDTAGNPVMVKVCYCGTTGCRYIPDKGYPLPDNFERIVELSKKVFKS